MKEFPSLRFRFASTMKHIPHFYVVRSAENEAEYVRLSNLIAAKGVWETWQDGKQYQYWYRGDGFKYWRIDPVINRAKV